MPAGWGNRVVWDTMRGGVAMPVGVPRSCIAFGVNTLPQRGLVLRFLFRASHSGCSGCPGCLGALGNQGTQGTPGRYSGQPNRYIPIEPKRRAAECRCATPREGSCGRGAPIPRSAQPTSHRHCIEAVRGRESGGAGDGSDDQQGLSQRHASPVECAESAGGGASLQLALNLLRLLFIAARQLLQSTLRY